MEDLALGLGDRGEVPRLKRFEILRCLGAGGFGMVYAARTYAPGATPQVVAVKRLHPGADAEAERRLRDETRVLAKIEHPRIPASYGLVRLGGRPCLVSEYVGGLTFSQASNVGLLGRGLLEAVGQAASVLAELHAQGTVHRDIKPSNLMLTPRGEVWLLDFGIALSAAAYRESRTQTGMCIGSPEYLSPERFTSRGCGAASDIYALGAVFWRLCFQHRPFPQELAARAAMGAVAHKHFLSESLSKLPGDCPEGLRELLARMLAFAEANRPEAGEVARLCEQLAPALPGPSLQEWVAGRTWPEPQVRDPYDLVGQVLYEDGLEEQPTTPVSSSSPFRTPSGPLRAPVGLVSGATPVGLVQHEPTQTRPTALSVGAGVVAFGAVFGLAGASFMLAVVVVVVQTMETQTPTVPAEVLVAPAAASVLAAQPQPQLDEAQARPAAVHEAPRMVVKPTTKAAPRGSAPDLPKDPEQVEQTQEPQLEILDAR